MKNKRSNPLTPRQKAEIDALAAQDDDRINTGDIPEVTDWSDAKRGVFFPRSEKLTR